MKKIFAMLAVLALVLMGMIALATPANASNGDKAHKWYVCKYVGTPGVDETLQTGQNPIFVDEHAIATYPNVQIGDKFEDKQGNSIVIAGPYKHKLNPEPGVDQCPAPEGPPPTDACPDIPGDQPEGTDCDTTEPPTDVCLNIDGNQETVPDGMLETADGNCYAPVLPTATAPTCNKDGVLVKFEQAPGIYAFYNPENSTGPGTYTVKFSNVNVPPLSEDGRNTYVIEVLPATGNCPVVPPECETGCTPQPPHHSRPPKHHTTVTHKHAGTPAPVPTVIESGLAGTKPVSADTNNDGLIMGGLIGLGLFLLCGGIAFSRRNN